MEYKSKSLFNQKTSRHHQLLKPGKRNREEKAQPGARGLQAQKLNFGEPRKCSERVPKLVHEVERNIRQRSIKGTS